MTNTMNTPIEALEAGYPLLVEKFRLRNGSGGRDRHPGGEGIQRDIRILQAAKVAMITERRTNAPYGLAGGGPGRRAERAPPLHRDGRRRPRYRADGDDVDGHRAVQRLRVVPADDRADRGGLVRFRTRIGLLSGKTPQKLLMVVGPKFPTIYHRSQTGNRLFISVGE